MYPERKIPTSPFQFDLNFETKRLKENNETFERIHESASSDMKVRNFAKTNKSTVFSANSKQRIFCCLQFTKLTTKKESLSFGIVFEMFHARLTKCQLRRLYFRIMCLGRVIRAMTFSTRRNANARVKMQKNLESLQYYEIFCQWGSRYVWCWCISWYIFILVCLLEIAGFKLHSLNFLRYLRGYKSI